MRYIRFGGKNAYGPPRTWTLSVICDRQTSESRIIMISSVDHGLEEECGIYTYKVKVSFCAP